MRLVPFDGSDTAGKTMKTQTFTVSGTWTKPDDVEYVLVDMCGGGASGSAGGTAGPGGGAGSYVRDLLLDVVGRSYAITVGSGGPSVTKAAGSANAVNGIAGGVSSFGAIASVSGGAVSGGYASIMLDAAGTIYYVGGKGMDCVGFGSGGGSSIGAASAGYTGVGYGSGGGGGATGTPANSVSSGSGRPGIVVIKWFE